MWQLFAFVSSLWCAPILFIKRRILSSIKMGKLERRLCKYLMFAMLLFGEQLKVEIRYEAKRRRGKKTINNSIERWWLWRWNVVTLLIPFVRCVHRNSIEHFIVLKVSIFTARTFTFKVNVSVRVRASMFTFYKQIHFHFKHLWISLMLDDARFIVLTVYKTKVGVGAIKKAMWKWWESKIVISLQLQFEQLNSFWYFIVVVQLMLPPPFALYISHLNMKRSTAEHFSTEMKMCNWN